MKRKVEQICADITDKLSMWEGVEAIVLVSPVTIDPDDPSLFISLDVYYHGDLIEPVKRHALFAEAGAFESSSVATKDRFIIREIPVRVEYKAVERIDTILERAEEHLYVFRQTGTYMFYRLATGSVLYKRSDWLNAVRDRMHRIPDSFWVLLRDSCRSTMEHYLSDLSAAVINDDAFFFLVSAAGFIKSFCSLLFVINHTFEPSGRQLYVKVFELPILPENFKGRFESFLREDPEFGPERKREVAELLAKSVVFMGA